MPTVSQNADLDMLSTSKILNLPDPTSAQDAATKAYVDAHGIGTFTASRALVTNSSGAVAVSTTTSAQIAALATLTNGRVPFSSGGALTDSANATLDSSGNLTLGGTVQAVYAQVRGQFNTTRQGMYALIDLAGTYRWEVGLDASNNLYFNDQANNKDVLTLLVGATYTTVRLPSVGTLSFNGGVTTIGLSSQATLSNTLEVNRGKILANSGSLGNVLAFSYYVTGNVAATNYSRITGTFTGTRTATLPDADITVAGSASALTSGRVPYVTTGGLLIDSAGYLFDGTSVITLGVSGTSVGGVKLNNATSGSVTLQPTTGALGTVTASFPAASIVVAGSASALTSGRVPFATTGGLLTDSANFTWDNAGIRFGIGGSLVEKLTVTGTGHTWILGQTSGIAHIAGAYYVTPTTELDFASYGGYVATRFGQDTSTGWNALYAVTGGLMLGTYNSNTFILGTNNTEAARFDTSQRFGINTTSLSAQFQVTSASSSRIGQIIKLASSQSADAFQVQNSSGTVGLLYNNDISGTGNPRLQISAGGSNQSVQVITLPTGTGSTQYTQNIGTGSLTFLNVAGTTIALQPLNANGLVLTGAASAVNYVSIVNAVTGSPAILGATGSDSVVSLKLGYKGAATIQINSTSTGIAENAAGVLEVNNGTAGGFGSLLYGLMVGNKTANYTVLSADKACFFTNAGAAGEVDFTLPTAVAGLHYTFYVMANQVLKVIAGASTSIRIAGSNSAAAGNITNSTIGGSVTLVAVSSTQWVARDTQGTWTVT